MMEENFYWNLSTENKKWWRFCSLNKQQESSAWISKESSLLNISAKVEINLMKRWKSDSTKFTGHE